MDEGSREKQHHPRGGSPVLRDGELVGVYRIVCRVGSGGMGEVYRAEHTGLHKVVALKVLRAPARDEDARVRFLREGELASKIQHPNIVDVTDVGEHEGTPYLVMEYLDGEPLSKALKRHGRFGVAEAADVLVPVAAAIAAAHAMGVVHRDIKPANVFMTQSALGEVVPKVVDFGISKVVDRTAPAITATHAFIGTPHYMSPEQAAGAGQATALSDQYSLGVMLYELVAGVRPFHAGSFLRLVSTISQGRCVPVDELRPELDEGLVAIINRAMALDPKERFPSLRDMARALLPHASERTRTLWAPRLEGSVAPVSQLRVRGSDGWDDDDTVASRTPHTAITVQDLDGVTAVSEPPAISVSEPEASGAPVVEVEGDTASDPISSLGPRSQPAPAAADDTVASVSLRREPARAVGSRAIRWAVAAAAAAVLLGAVALKSRWRTGAPAAGPAVPTNAGAAPHTPTFRVAIVVEPSRADIRLDGQSVGEGSFVGLVPRDGKLHRLEVTAAGYQPRTLNFRDVAPDEKVTLQPLAVPSTRPRAVVPASPSVVPAAGNTAAASATSRSAATAVPSASVAPAPSPTSTTGNIDPWQSN